MRYLPANVPPEWNLTPEELTGVDVVLHVTGSDATCSHVGMRVVGDPDHPETQPIHDDAGRWLCLHKWREATYERPLTSEEAAKVGQFGAPIGGAIVIPPPQALWVRMGDL